MSAISVSAIDRYDASGRGRIGAARCSTSLICTASGKLTAATRGIHIGGCRLHCPNANEGAGSQREHNGEPARLDIATATANPTVDDIHDQKHDTPDQEPCC